MTGSHVLVLAPHGRDETVAAALLKAAGMDSVLCPDLAALERALDHNASFVIVAEEAMRTADLRGIVSWVRAQPSWSDLPFIILTQHGGGPERNPGASRLSDALGNVTFLERPFHPTTFVSIARTALNGRKRQFEVRARIEDLRLLNETLEQRVMARTAELERAHATVLAEIAQREDAEEKLRQAQKMEMIGQLTGGVAHDFNNLLMAVLGNLDLLRKHVAGDAKATRLIDGALQGAKRGAALTQRLLAFARKQKLSVEPTDLIALVNGMTGLLERSVGPQIELRLQLPAKAMPVLADANQVELALLNLVINARDAMPEGGVISIELDMASASLEDDLPTGNYVRLVVSDTGHGMDSETLRRAVHPFFSTKEPGKGTGLGLSMIHGLAEQLNGTLRLSSESGRGTRAELWLPTTTAAPVTLEPSRVRENRHTPARSTILLVEDDALIAMSTVDMLEDLGHEVIEANSGSSALEILEDGRAVDLMITDYSMPMMTGMELAMAARHLRPALPILLATGYADLPDSTGIDLPRLGKPYQQDQLAAEIAKLLEPEDKNGRHLSDR